MCIAKSEALEIDKFNFEQSYFELFDLPVNCEIDSGKLREKYMELQRQYHPDRFVASSDATRMRAVQIAAHVNGAHQTLDVPLKRAEYCLQLAGLSTDSETDAKMDPMFLMQQMELREALEEVSSSPDPWRELDAARAQINEQIGSTSVTVGKAIEDKQYDEAREYVRRWQFLEKLLEEASSIEAQLDDA